MRFSHILLRMGGQAPRIDKYTSQSIVSTQYLSMSAVVIKQISAWTPQRSQGPALHLKIQFDGHGYWLIAEALNGGYCLDCWHPSLAKAEQTARDQFGASAADWDSVAVA